MRHIAIATLCLGGLALAACDRSTPEAEVERALKNINVVDESNLNHVMLNSADPKEAVAYFRRSVADNPDRMDLKRGLGLSLVRAGAAAEAASVLRKVVDSPEATEEDRVALADALIRTGDWAGAETVLDEIPPTYETYRRYRLEAMVADANEQWKDADFFYDTALGLTTKPAGVLNNWGYSKLTRGDYPGAENLFGEALGYDPNLFTAKNNLTLARGAQRNYDLPVVRMTQTERAQLLHTLGLAAIKQGDVAIGKGLLRNAIDTHPQHFEAAAMALDALEDTVAN